MSHKPLVNMSSRLAVFSAMFLSYNSTSQVSTSKKVFQVFGRISVQFSILGPSFLLAVGDRLPSGSKGHLQLPAMCPLSVWSSQHDFAYSRPARESLQAAKILIELKHGSDIPSPLS